MPIMLDARFHGAVREEPRMYGTVARMKVKPGSLEALQQQMASLESDLSAGGWRSTTVYQSDSDPNELWIAVAFESKEAYRKNAESPDRIHVTSR